MYIVVTLSVSLSEYQSVRVSVCHFYILEKAPFSGSKLTSVHCGSEFENQIL